MCPHQVQPATTPQRPPDEVATEPRQCDEVEQEFVHLEHAETGEQPVAPRRAAGGPSRSVTPPPPDVEDDELDDEVRQPT